ncbi:MAG: DUF296 domain-containing protein [Deltaproteobacteria bacterium]|nr:DUF296 domain-containing protein [Deltaproteobacteria bacterium]
MDPVCCTDPRVVLGRLDRGDDLLEGLLGACAAAGVRTGAILGIGALERAHLGWYDPVAQVYEERTFEGPLEVVSCLGNLSERDTSPFVHLHLAVAGRDLAVRGGHALPGCRVFALEFTLVALDRIQLVRKLDPLTGLMLW